MFHIEHLNVLKQAKEQCDYLIVGVSTDELVQYDTNKTPIIIPFAERCAIIEAIKYVDKVVPPLDKKVWGMGTIISMKCLSVPMGRVHHRG